jgi:hypothetical protein
VLLAATGAWSEHLLAPESSEIATIVEREIPVIGGAGDMVHTPPTQLN